MANYRKHSREQIEMKMMCVNDFVPKDHKARVIVSIIRKLDLNQFDAYFTNDSGGNAAYPIEDLLSLLVYAYLEGVYKSRKIELYCHENIVYKYLCCDDPPDHTTISRFWKRFKKSIEEILVQTVFIGESQNLIDYKHISGDGVKIKSMGSRNSLYSEQSAEKRLEYAEKRICNLVTEIAKAQTSEEKDLLTKKFEKQKSLKTRIENGVKELKSIKEAVKRSRKAGTKKENTNYLSLTEKDAKLMKKRDSYLSGYNAQVIVDSKTQMVVTSDVSSNCSDAYLGEPLLEKMKSDVGIDNYTKGEKSFDNGYFETSFIKYAFENDLDLYLDTSSVKRTNSDQTKKLKKNDLGLKYDAKNDVYYCQAGKKLLRKRISYNGNNAFVIYERYGCKQSNCIYFTSCMTDKVKRRKRKSVRCPSLDKNKSEYDDGVGLVKRMVNKMETPEAKKIYKMRFRTVEPVFAQIEENRGFRRFSVWGLEKAKGQWAFVCFIHNLSKIINYSNYVRNAAHVKAA